MSSINLLFGVLLGLCWSCGEHKNIENDKKIELKPFTLGEFYKLKC